MAFTATADFRDLISVEQAVETVTASGAIVSEWLPVARVWANVEPQQGREYWTGTQTVTERVYNFKTRYSRAMASVEPARYRIAYAGRTYDVRAVMDVDNRHREIAVRCVQRD